MIIPTLLLVLLQQPAQDPAEAEAVQVLEATIVAIKGTVDVKRPSDKEWVAAERNMKLPRGAEICTAMSSSATVLITGRIQVDIGPLTQTRIELLVESKKGVEADLNLRFGTIEVDIQKGDLRADMTVATPHSTTSVSGSRGIIRAPASGPGHIITLRTFSGTWSRKSLRTGITSWLEGSRVTNDFGEARRDLTYRYSTHQVMNFFGRNASELYQDPFSVKGGDPNPGLAPLFEQSSTFNPINGVFTQPAGLPLPPPPPGVP